MTVQLPLFRLGRGLGFPISASVSLASGQIITVTTRLASGAASGSSHRVVGGGVTPPEFQPRFIPHQSVKVRGRIITARCWIIPGAASGTELKGFIWAGKASADANAEPQIIQLRNQLVAGKANGERYLSDEEQLILMFAEAA